jgi:hypothetical protein
MSDSESRSLGPSSLALARQHYPDPFLDFASTQLPKSYQKLLEMCRVVAMTHPQIAPILRKYARYPLTHIIFKETLSESIKSWWQDVLNNDLRIISFMESVGLDLFTYGAAYVTSARPFLRAYVCKLCGFAHEANVHQLKYEIRGKDRFVAKCMQCKKVTDLHVKDIPLHTTKRMSLVRLSPMEVTPKRNPVTGHAVYYSSPPAMLKRALRNINPDRDMIDTTPVTFIMAALNAQKIKWKDGTILHLMEPAPSGVDYHQGMPRLLPALKTIYLDQLYRKSDESAALERTLPARFVYPQPTAANPFKTISLAQFHRFIARSLKRWRQDKNAVMTSPFPIGVAEIGNDAAQYNTTPMRQQGIKEIVNALGAPEGFFGEMTWSGGSVQLRMMENDIMTYVRALQDLIHFAIEEVSAVTGVPTVKASLKPFKSIDDVQQQQMLMSLAQQEHVPYEDVLDSLGKDWDDCHKRVRREKELMGDLRIQDMMLESKALLGITSLQQVNQTRAQGWVELDKQQRDTSMQAGAHLTREQTAGQVEQQAEQSEQAQATEQQRIEEKQRKLEERLMMAKIKKEEAKAERDKSESGKLDQHATYYGDQKELRDDQYRGKAVSMYADNIEAQPAARKHKLLQELEQGAPTMHALVVSELEERASRRQAGGGSTQGQEPSADVTNILTQLRGSSSSPQDLANKILMQEPHNRQGLIDALVKSDPVLANKVLRRYSDIAGAERKSRQTPPVRPQPEQLPPRRTGL